MILGTISAVDSDNGLQLIIDGEDAPTTKKYTYMASYVPSANDRVLIDEISGSYVIIGKVVNDVASSGISRTATNATYAVTSETCSGNAASATTAESLDGYGDAMGGIVTNVQTQYSATLGGYYVSGVTLLNGNYLKKS